MSNNTLVSLITLMVIVLMMSTTTTVHAEKMYLSESNNNSSNKFDIPFYVKKDDNGNLIAIIVYGDTIDEQYQVPCTKTKTTLSDGPNVVQCFCVNDDETPSTTTIDEDNDNKLYYNLIVPFRFVRNDEGEIIGVEFEDEDKNNNNNAVENIQTIIPFTVTKDSNGNVIGVVYVNEDINTQENTTKNGSSCDVISIILTVIGLLFVISGIGYLYKTRSTTTTKNMQMQAAASSGPVVVEKSQQQDDDHTHVSDNDDVETASETK